MSRRLSTTLLVVAVVLLFVFNLSLWLWTTIVDSDTFAETTTSALTSEESRESIADVIVTRLLAERPLVLAAVGDELKGVVAGILGRERFEERFEQIASTLHRMLTTTGIREISIDVSRIREVVGAVSEILNVDADTGRLADQPDQVVLFEGRDFPNIRKLADTIPWVTTIAGMLVAGILAAVFVWTRERTVALRRLGIMMTTMAIFTILLILPIRSSTQSSFPTDTQQVVVGNLFDAYAVRLLYQSVAVAVIGAVLVGLAIWSARAHPVSRPVTAEPSVEPSEA